MPVELNFSPNQVRRAVYQRRNPVVPRPAYVPPRFPGHPVINEEDVTGQHQVGPTPPPPTPIPGAGGGGSSAAGGSYAPPVPGRGTGILNWNPQLIPLLPDQYLGGYTDASYEADKNQALSDFYDKYHTTLRALGYMDEQGHPIAGDLADQFQTSQALGQRSLTDEERQVTEASQLAGTLFSGVRARDLGLAQRETVQSLADLDMGYQRDRSKGLEDIFGAGGEYASLISALRQAYIAAAQRKADSLTA